MNYYVDMDGVLANFDRERNAVERFRVEKGFFYKLKPFKNNVKSLRKQIKENKNQIFILTASPNEQADGDKIKWLEKYVPEMKKENIICIRNGQRKVDYMKTNKGVLFDDYHLNLEQWLENKENHSWCIFSDGDLEKGFSKYNWLN